MRKARPRERGDEPFVFGSGRSPIQPLRGAAALRDEAEGGGGEQADAGGSRNRGAAGRAGGAGAGAAGMGGGRRSGRNGGGHESDTADDESLLEHLCLLFARAIQVKF